MRPCPICDTEAARSARLMPRLPLVVCLGCGVLYRPDRPTNGQVAPAAPGPHYAESEPAGKTTTDRAHTLADWLNGRLPPRPTLLEIASADTGVMKPLGSLLPGARLRGADVADFARSGTAAAAMERTSRGWERGTVRDVRYDVVVFPYSLQRVPDVVGALQSAREALDPAGYLYVHCTNLLEPHPRKRLRTFLEAQHWSCLSLSNLATALARAGFAVARRAEDTSLRVLARPAAAVRPAATPALGGVAGALVRHELRYWPAYVLRGLTRG